MVRDGHLGSFIPGGDSRCHYPAMWDQLIKDFGIKSVIDIGSGQGQALQYFQDKGCDVVGIDGSALVLRDNPLEVKNKIIIHDYTQGPYKPLSQFDLGWSCEFVEHVEEKYISNFMTTFLSCKVVALSHALPGQGGYHHVLEREDSFWIKEFEQRGFRLNAEKTKEYRNLAHEYFQRSGLVFVKSA